MNKMKKGFTLVEMLIVVVIIGILAATILPKLQGAQGATRDVARLKGMTDIAQALEQWVTHKGTYPEEGPDCVASGLTGLINRQYIKSIPTDTSKASPGIVLWENKCKGGRGEFTYRRVSKGGIANNGYILAAKAETLDGANATAAMLAKWAGKDEKNLKYEDIKLCDSMDIGTPETSDKPNASGSCLVEKLENLRIVVAG